jgi:hypothetical protein
VLIAYDNDPAGDQGAARWAAFGERVRVPLAAGDVPDGAKDLSDYSKAGGDLGAWLRLLIDDGVPGVFGWTDDYLAAVLDMLGRIGCEPRITPAGNIVAERERLKR